MLKGCIKTILVAITFILLLSNCSTGLLSLEVRPDAEDTLFVYSDELLPFEHNKKIPYKFNEQTRLYEYKVYANYLTLINYTYKKKNVKGNWDDSIRAHIPCYYLKFVRKGEKIFIAGTKEEIFKMYKTADDLSQGIISF